MEMLYSWCTGILQKETLNCRTGRKPPTAHKGGFKVRMRAHAQWRFLHFQNLQDSLKPQSRPQTLGVLD